MIVGRRRGEHRLADPRRPDEEQVVAAGGRGGQREPGAREPAHVDEVEWFVGVGVVGRRAGLGRIGPGLFALQARVQLFEVAREAYVHTGDQLGFRRVGRGHDHEVGAGARERVDECERSGNRPHRAVEAELAEHTHAVERAGGEPAVGACERERHGELEPGTGLAHRCRREVHRDAFHRIRQIRREQRGAHALARLAAGRVGKTDDRVAGRPRDTWTSTVTTRPTTPSSTALFTDASTQRPPHRVRSRGVRLRFGSVGEEVVTATSTAFPAPYERGATASHGDPVGGN